MDFEQAHQSFIDSHLARRTGERKGRLSRGHQHAETLYLKNIWWPLKRDFDYLHPEYEVLDWRGRSYFSDFAFLPPSNVRFIWEVKGYATHVRDMDRKRFCDELNRETFLQILGYRVISFAYDDVAERPELCITQLRMLLSRYEAGTPKVERAVLAEKEVIRLALQLACPIRPIDVSRHMSLDYRSAVNILQRLCVKQWLRPVKTESGQRTIRYELTREAVEYID